jgi:hypothetical protein
MEIFHNLDGAYEALESDTAISLPPIAALKPQVPERAYHSSRLLCNSEQVHEESCENGHKEVS